ncbi:MAG: hypothetical protein Q4B80_00485 [Aerococcaceae bacterium]|nr:hypothetical protein [Aerococcaceae bacterium]
MRKRNQWFVSLLASFILTGPVSPVANSHANPTEVLTKVDEVGKATKSVHSAGFLSVASANQGQLEEDGQFNFDLKVNREEPNSFAFLSALSTGGLEIEVYLKDNVMTVIALGQVLFHEEITDEVEEITDKASEIKAEFEIESKLTTPEQILKMMNFTENDTHYVLSLKEDLDIDALWEEVTKGLDVNQAKAEYIKQMEAQGLEVDEATLVMIDKVYNKEFVRALFATFNPKVEVHYAKDTYYLTTFKTELDITATDLATLVTEFYPEKVSDIEELPETILIKFEVNFDGHNQPQNIEVPEVTVTPVETSSSAE